MLEPKVLTDNIKHMEILAVDKPHAFIVDSKDAKDFIERANKNVISKEFLEECMEVSKLFKKCNDIENGTK